MNKKQVIRINERIISEIVSVTLKKILKEGLDQQWTSTMTDYDDFEPNDTDRNEEYYTKAWDLFWNRARWNNVQGLNYAVYDRYKGNGKAIKDYFERWKFDPEEIYERERKISACLDEMLNEYFLRFIDLPDEESDEVYGEFNNEYNTDFSPDKYYHDLLYSTFMHVLFPQEENYVYDENFGNGDDGQMVNYYTNMAKKIIAKLRQKYDMYIIRQAAKEVEPYID